MRHTKSHKRNTVPMFAVADHGSAKPSNNGRRSPSIGTSQRSRSQSPSRAPNRGTLAPASNLEPRTSSYRQLSVTGGDRGRPPRPPSPLINAARPAVPQRDYTATLSAANGGLTPMRERNRSNSLPSRHGVISQKLPPGKLKPCTSLTDRPQAPYPMQRGSHLDGPSPVQNVR